MDEKALLEAIGQMMDEKLEPLQEDVRGMQKDLRDMQEDLRSVQKDVSTLKAGQKNIIKRLVKIEAVQEYLIEHVDNLEQRDPA
ncbi:MAG: hypothetical protein HFJ80_05275 [Clostridiales bacterium]|nr:hypothetical protein [Clostridiales bacterium]